MRIARTPPVPRAASPSVPWQATWVAGPACAGPTSLGAEVHRVGTHRLADLRVDDEMVAPFHLELRVAPDGRLGVLALAGAAEPAVLAGAPDDDASPAGATGGRVWLEPGVRWLVAVGASVLELATDAARPVADLRVPPVPGRDRVVHRAARPAGPAVPAAPPPRLGDDRAADVPAADASAAGALLPAAVGVAGALVMAVLMHQPLFAVFAGLGALAALTTWLAQRRAARRARRAAVRGRAVARAARDAAVDAQRRSVVGGLLAGAGGVAGATHRAATGGGLWERRHDHGDAWTVTVGLGHTSWSPAGTATEADAAATVLHGVPILTGLGPGDRLSLTGAAAHGVARGLLVQLLTQVGPADWRLLVVTDRPASWQWCTGLPHTVAAGGEPLVVDEDGALALHRDRSWVGERHLVIVTDLADRLGIRTSAVRRLLAHDRAPALVVLDPRPTTAVPAVCTAALRADGDGTARWTPDLAAGAAIASTRIRWSGITEAAAAAICALLRSCRDPEDTDGDQELATTVDLGAVLGLATGGTGIDPGAIAARWQAGARGATVAVLGTAADGEVAVDLVRDGPHALLAGTTGSGKSELLRTLVLSLAAHEGPDRLQFVLVDYKGGAAFDACRGLPHVVGTVTDLDDRLAERALRSLRAELRHRERVLRAHGAGDLDAARRSAGTAVLARLVVVVDEFAALATELPEFLHALVDVAQRGRSLGVHLVLATQRPAGVVSDDIRANTNLRLALRVQDTADAVEVIGDPAAAALPRRIPGRAVLRLGPDELVTFQTASSAAVAPHLVEAACAAAHRLGLVPTRRPWSPPLPARLERAGCPERSPDAVGVVDLPDEQSVRTLRWQPSAGHVLVAGAPGSGVSSTLRTLAAVALGAGRGVVVIDAQATLAEDSSWAPLAEHPGCVGVVGLDESERLLRALRVDGGTVLVVDGIDRVRAALDGPEHVAAGALLHDVLTGGRRAPLLLGTHAPSAVPPWLTGRCPNRWLLHLHDPADGAAWGVPGAMVPPAVAGRAVLAGAAEAELTGAAAQLVVPPWPPPRPPAGAMPARAISTLPARIESLLLPPAVPATDGWALTLGLRFDDLGPWRFEVPDGEHALVLGPPRSGRSSCLARFVQAWRDHGPSGGGLVVLAPRRSPVRDLAGPHAAGDVHGVLAALAGRDRPALVVVDDAELVDDVDGGALAALIGSRRPGLLVVAAARAEALRGQYGHWTTAVRRSRRGIVMTGAGDADADLLAVSLPRRLVIAPRPGLGFGVADGGVVLGQVASDDRVGPGAIVPGTVGSGTIADEASIVVRA